MGSIIFNYSALARTHQRKKKLIKATKKNQFTLETSQHHEQSLLRWPSLVISLVALVHYRKKLDMKKNTTNALMIFFLVRQIKKNVK